MFHVKPTPSSTVAILSQVIENTCIKNDLAAPTEAELSQLSSYLDLLVAWTDRVDLVSPAPIVDLAERHIADSFAAWRKLAAVAPVGGVADIGSGAGLPGLVIALLDPARTVFLVEPREKRTLFLAEVRRKLSLSNVAIEVARLEAFLSKPRSDVSLLVTRATGLEAEMLAAARSSLVDGGMVSYLVGPSWEAGILGLSPKNLNDFSYMLPRAGATHRVVTVDVPRGTVLPS